MFRNIAVGLTGDGTSLGRALRQGAAEVDQFGNRVEATNARTSKSWLKTAAAVGVVVVSLHAVQAGFDATVGAAAGYEARLRNVNSITHASDSELRSLGASTLALSRELPQSANVLAEGLYDIASSGFQGAAGLTVLEASAEAASAGLTSTANSGKAIAAVLNAYGLEARDATNVSDSLFQTVNLGVVSFEELTGVIGDVVGTAAAASVDINQVGAAVATMTLSGISAAESGTSLNRVLQSLLQPSQSLAVVLGQLGYESGEQALRTDGLRVVMERLRVATGGNVTTLLQLFPEIRAARGALALMSDEGRNYAKVADDIEDKDRRQGATRRALNEQLKAASTQWQLFQNRAQAAGIEAGTELLPVVIDLLDGVQRLAGDGLPMLVSGFEAVEPLMSAVAGITGDVVGLIIELAQIAGPAAAGLLAIAGAPILAGLTGIAETLEALTSFLDENEGALLALAAVAGGAYLVSVLKASAATGLLATTALRSMYAWQALNTSLLVTTARTAGAAGSMGALRIGMGLAATQAKALTAAVFSLQTVATLGFAAVIGLGLQAVNSWNQAGDAADQFVAKTTDGFDALDEEAAERKIRKLRKTVDEGFETFNETRHPSPVLTQFSRGIQGIFGDLDDVARRTAAAADEAEKRSLQVSNAAANLQVLEEATGRSRASLVKLARDNDLDLTKPVRRSGEEIRTVIDLTRDLERQTGLSGQAMEAAVGADTEAVEALGKAVEEAGQKVSDAFSGATDIIATFDPDAAAGKLTSATEAQADALRSLSQLEARNSSKKKSSVADEQALANARSKVAEATTRVGEAQADQVRSTLSGQYEANIAAADRFADDIQKATRRGLDPQLVVRLLKEGPETAAPVLQALVADHSGRLIRMANRSEETLRQINTRVVEFSRLTTLATQASTDDMVNDLGRAMAIASENLASGGKATITQLARRLNIPRDEVRRIAEEFGITLQAELAAQNLKVPVQVQLRGTVGSGKLQQLTNIIGRAGGGPIRGPGSTTSDSIFMAASNDEHMLSAAEVAAAGGHGAIMAWRQMVLAQRTPFVKVPGYAYGGPITRGDAGTQVVTVRVPLSETRTHSAPINVEHMAVADYTDFRRQESLERLRAGQRSGRAMP